MTSMTDINIQDLNSSNVPFFARFLEGQMDEVSEAEAAEAIGGRFGNRPTNKLADQAQTQKFPSDQEDSSPPIVTQKFPSDQEDSVRPIQFPFC
jgi:hypothetical protein